MSLDGLLKDIEDLNENDSEVLLSNENHIFSSQEESSSLPNFSDAEDQNEDFYQRASQISGKKLHSFHDILRELEYLHQLMLKSKKTSDSNFLLLFNDKCSTNFNSSNEIVDYVKKLQDDNKKLKTQLKSSPENAKEDELELSAAKLKIASLSDQVERITQTKTTLETAFHQVQNLVENQQEEINQLVSQKNSLVQLLNKLDIACSQTEAKYQALLSKNEPTNQSNNSFSHNDTVSSALSSTSSISYTSTAMNSSLPLNQSISMNSELNQNSSIIKSKLNSHGNAKISEDELLYAHLSVISRTITASIDSELSQKIDLIKNNSNLPISERIVQMTKFILNQYKLSLEKQNSLHSNLKVLEEEKNKLQQRLERLLLIFEEEIQFLQKITNSRDLQNVILYRNETGKSLEITSQMRDELIRRCAQLGTFLDENIGNISNFAHSIPSIESRVNIFTLLSGAPESETKINTILSNFEETPENKELFDLLFVQILFNEILERHALDLHSRIALSKNELSKFDVIKQHSYELEQQNTQLIQTLKIQHKIDKKLRRKLRIDKSEDLVQAILSIIERSQTKEAKELNESKGLNESKDLNESKELKQSNISQQSNISNISKASKHSSPKIQKGMSYEELKNILKEQEEQINNYHLELQSKITLLNEKEEQYNDLEKQYKLLIQEKQDFQPKIQNLLDQKEKISQELNDLKGSQISLLAQKDEQISQLKIDLKFAQQESQKILQLQNEISESQTEKKGLKKKIKELEQINLKSVQNLKDKANALRSQYDKIVIDVSQYQNTNNLLNQQIQNLTKELESTKSKSEELEIIRKTLELKIKALEDKNENDIKALQSKYSASITSIKAECDSLSQQKVADIQNQLNQITSSLISLLDTQFNLQIKNNNTNNNRPSFANEIVQAIMNEFNNLKQKQSLYSGIMEDIAKSQQLLTIDVGQPLAPAISTLLIDYEKLKNESISSKKTADDVDIQIKKLSKDNIKLQEMAVGMKQWEAWAARMIKMVQQSSSFTNTIGLSNERLRLSLEEILLNSVSHQAIYRKMIALREEKKALVKYGNKFYHSKIESQPSWNSLLTIAAFCNRSMKLAGYSPLCIPKDISAFH